MIKINVIIFISGIVMACLIGCDCMETPDDTDADAGGDTDTDTDTDTPPDAGPEPDAGAGDCDLDIEAHEAACDLLGLYLAEDSIYGEASTAKAWTYMESFCPDFMAQFDPVTP